MFQTLQNVRKSFNCDLKSNIRKWTTKYLTAQAAEEIQPTPTIPLQRHLSFRLVHAKICLKIIHAKICLLEKNYQFTYKDIDLIRIVFVFKLLCCINFINQDRVYVNRRTFLYILCSHFFVMNTIRSFLRCFVIQIPKSF